MEKFDLPCHCDHDSYKDCVLYGRMLRTVGRPRGISADAVSGNCHLVEFVLLTLSVRDCVSPQPVFKPVKFFADGERVVAVVRREDFARNAWRSLRGCLRFGEEGSPTLFVGASADGGESELKLCCVV